MDIINEVGNAFSPVFLFSRVRNLIDYIVEGPTSSIDLGSENDWMTSENVLEDLKHLVVEFYFCLTIMRVEAIIYCRQNGIIPISLTTIAAYLCRNLLSIPK